MAQISLKRDEFKNTDVNFNSEQKLLVQPFI